MKDVTFDTILKEKLSYEDCLTEFKKSVEGDDALSALENSIKSNFSKNKLRVLDVGIGDGRYLTQLSKRLQGLGFSLVITGVDTDISSCNTAVKNFPEAKIFHGDFSMVEITETFDVILLSQSIYYFSNTDQIINKCISLLNPGGMILIVCWSENDDLYKFTKNTLGVEFSTNTTAEGVEELLRSKKMLSALTFQESIGTVDFSRWKNERSFFMSTFVMSRGDTLISGNARTLFNAFEKFKGEKSMGTRLNIVISAKKSV